jgi:hypothetical protein
MLPRSARSGYDIVHRVAMPRCTARPDAACAPAQAGRQRQHGIGLMCARQPDRHHKQQRCHAKTVLHSDRSPKRHHGQAGQKRQRHRQPDHNGGGHGQCGHRRQQPVIELHRGDVLGDVARQRLQARAPRARAVRPSAGRCCSRGPRGCGDEAAGHDGQCHQCTQQARASARAFRRRRARRCRSEDSHRGPDQGGIQQQREERGITSRWAIRRCCPAESPTRP